VRPQVFGNVDPSATEYAGLGLAQGVYRKHTVLKIFARLLLPLALTVSCTDFTDDVETIEQGGCMGGGGAKAAGESPGFVFRRAEAPARTNVYDHRGKWLASFTDGARTVRLLGPTRDLAEPGAVTVRSTTWVRLLDAPFDGTVDREWLAETLNDTSPDILAIAIQYTTGAPAVMSGGRQIAGDASYGPLVDGSRQEGSDFHDYLGITYKLATGTVMEPDPTQLGSLDCSGFVRMVMGYRGGIPMALRPRADRSLLPRRSIEIFEGGPGVMVIPDTGVQVTDFSKVEPGDLVFHDADDGDGPVVDHSGIYVGRDLNGRHRFVNSRKSMDGPTMGDGSTPSLLDGKYLFARTFRGTRRL
jgi:hypothetical protein